MSSRKIKKKLLELLAESTPEGILQEFHDVPVKDVINALFSGICREDETVRWNAVRCMGFYVPRLAEQDMEEARIVMRRMLWSLNDESGGIGWGAPESMAEIMANHEKLAAEYIHMLISYMREDGEELFQDGNYLEHEVLQRGLLWGIGRLAAANPSMLEERGVADDLPHYLASSDAAVRGLAARCLGLLGAEESGPVLQELQEDSSLVSVYENDCLATVTVGDLARQALHRIAEKDSCK